MLENLASQGFSVFLFSKYTMLHIAPKANTGFVNKLYNYDWTSCELLQISQSDDSTI